MDLGNASLMTNLMDQFRAGALAGATNILPDALALLATLSTIELALTFIFNRDQDPIMIITEKFLQIGFIAWFTANWASGQNLSKQIFDTFQMFGITAALGGDGRNGITDPSYVLEMGISKIIDILASIMSVTTAAGVMGNLALLFMKIVLMFVILGCFGWMAIQLFITYIEFYLTSTLSVILIPFAVLKHTRFMAEKAFGAAASFGIKVMVLQFILCIGIPLAEQWVIAVNNTDMTPLLRAVFGCLGLAFLTWQAPNYIQGLLSGSPSFGAGDVVGGARAVASGAVNTVSAPMRIAGFTQAAMNAPGGRNNNGSTNWSGTASNMGTMLRQRMPDRQSELHNQVMFANAKAMLKQQKAREMAKRQTNLFD